MSFYDVPTDIILAEGGIPTGYDNDATIPPPAPIKEEVPVKEEPNTITYCSKTINPSRLPRGRTLVAPGYKLSNWRYSRSRKDQKYIKNIFTYLMK